jgi:quercetin dioxygenase-like cupin family protein
METDRPAIVASDLDATPGGGGAVWSLPHDGDLDANLVRLAPEHGIDDHVNDEVDVLIVVREGGGELTVDGVAHALAGATLALVPRGCHRSITAGPRGIAYLTVHRRRAPLAVGHAD